ncbi:MAG: sigma-70 family RNA polymerase sigma factor [Oscillospiraceae bacterium]|jgi:RNA polymerase sigma-70 factor (ECF subfamily)|nr:sigma-70 family RNA polymerase sigma factor [Oscillospiraceae bacterium]
MLSGMDKDEQVEIWVRRYSDGLLRVCYVYLRDVGLAEDAVQDTFMKAYRKIDEQERYGGAYEKTWLMRIAINTCKDYLRWSWFRYVDRRKEIERLEAAADASPEDSLITLEIMRLPFKLKEVIMLYYYQEMTLREIASALGVSISAVAKRLNKAKDALKHMLSDEGGVVE